MAQNRAGRHETAEISQNLAVIDECSKRTELINQFDNYRKVILLVQKDIYQYMCQKTV
jgi:hypothetical protein